MLLIGTADYTAIGRPVVTKAKVYCTVEEESRTSKVIIFKKQRRKGYQKNMGHRQTVQVLRVDRIDHDISEADFVDQEPQNLTFMQKRATPANDLLF